MQCEIDGCTKNFTKRKHLRTHILSAHSSIGQSFSDLDREEAERIARLPFACTHHHCQKRFATNSKRNAHVRSHEDKTKYMCALQHGEGKDSVLYFASWSELQSHQRQSHPPTCTWPNCGRTFANTQNLKHHMQRHKEKDSEGNMRRAEASESEEEGLVEEEQKRTKKVLYSCDWISQEGQSTKCDKVFRSKYSRNVHIKNNHLGLREYVCSHCNCNKRYGNKRSLNRHLLKCGHRGEEVHSHHETEGEENAESVDVEPDDDFFRQEGGAVPETFAGRQPAPKRAREEGNTSLGSLLSSLTGSGYGQSNTLKKRRMRGRVVACPWSTICSLRNGESNGSEAISCPFRFSRLYDVQRHLESKHGIMLSQLEISTLLSEEEGSRLATPRLSFVKTGLDEFVQEPDEAEN